MFDTHYDPYSRKGVTILQGRLDAALHGMNTEQSESAEFFLASCAAPCTDPALGVYVELYGIDRICAWQDLTPETLEDCGPPFLLLEDLDMVKRVPEHLERCRRCLASSFVYATYIEQSLDLVNAMARDGLARYTDAGPLSDEERGDILLGLQGTAYGYLVSVSRMQQRQKVINEITRVACDDDRFVRMCERDGIHNHSELLLASDAQLRRKRRSDLYRLSPDARYRRLKRLSAHVGTCVRCAFMYIHEKNEASYQRVVFERL